MLTTSIEALLFTSGKPLKITQLKKLFDVSDEVLIEAVEDIRTRFNTDKSGIHLLEHEEMLQLVSNPDEAETVSQLNKQEVGGELSRPSLETLTIIAYRGPVTKPEIEQIRGVNCSLILRNLMIRGLIEEKMSTEKILPAYIVSVEFLRHLGLSSISELTDYTELHDNEKITSMLEELSEVDGDEL